MPVRLTWALLLCYRRAAFSRAFLAFRTPTFVLLAIYGDSFLWQQMTRPARTARKRRLNPRFTHRLSKTPAFRRKTSLRSLIRFLHKSKRVLAAVTAADCSPCPAS